MAKNYKLELHLNYTATKAEMMIETRDHIEDNNIKNLV